MTAHSRSYLLEHILGSLLYISSKEADVRTVYVPQKNQSRKSRQTDCTVHDVGFRIAPQLAEVRRVYEHERQDGKTGRHVAPHVRRGHWHGYWTGPREKPTGLEIKWIAPTVVNASRGELGGTVHEVGEDNAVDFQFGVDSALIDAAAPKAKAGSYDLAPTGDAGATLTLKAQGDAKNVKEDIAKDKTVATITWTFAAGNAAGGISVDDSWEGNHEMGID